MYAPVTNLLHGECTMLFCFVQAVTIALLLVFFLAVLLRFYSLQDMFYSVLHCSTSCELCFTPCYPVLLRFTLFYYLLATFYFVLLLRAFTSCFYFVPLSATLFYPLRTTFYFVLLSVTPRTFLSSTPFYHLLTTFFTSFLSPCWCKSQYKNAGFVLCSWSVFSL